MEDATKVNVMVSLGLTGGVRGWKMTTKVNAMVSLEVNRRGEGVEGVEDDYQSECDGESGG